MRFIPRPHRKDKKKDAEQLELDRAFEIRMNMIKSVVGGIHESDPQSGVILVSHLPHGFYKSELWKFFSQFGRIKRIRMSMSKKTGRSRGYAFIEFEYAEVAKIAAETMNNHLMFLKLLKCCVVPKEKLHPETFKNCYKTFQIPLGTDISVKRHNSLMTADPGRIRKSIKRRTKLERKNQKKLEAMGIDYKIKGYADEWEEAKSKAALSASVSSSSSDKKVTSSEEEEKDDEKEETIVEKIVDDEKIVEDEKKQADEWEEAKSKAARSASVSSSDKKVSLEEEEKDDEKEETIVEKIVDDEKIVADEKIVDEEKIVDDEMIVDEMIVDDEKKRASKRKQRAVTERSAEESEEDVRRSKTPATNGENSETPRVETPMNSKTPNKRNKMNTVTPAKRRKSERIKSNRKEKVYQK